MKAIKEFYDNMDFLDKFQFIFGLMALIIVFSIIIYAICCWIKPPATICLDGHTYVKYCEAVEPVQMVDRYGYIYVLKETDE